MLEDLVRECPPRAKACVIAAMRYLEALHDPCGVRKGTWRMGDETRRYFFQFLAKYGMPRCDVEGLIRERAARFLGSDAMVQRAARLARLLRSRGTSYRVAAAAAVVHVARSAGLGVVLSEVAQAFNCTDVAVRSALQKLRNILISQPERAVQVLGRR